MAPREQTKTDDGPTTAVRTILGLSEEKMGEVVSQLLANEAFVGVVQQAITRSLEAKRGMDKSVATMLSLVNVPTLEDVEKIRNRLNEVEESMAEIASRIEGLTDNLDARAPKKK
jgi:hypothetical protein